MALSDGVLPDSLEQHLAIFLPVYKKYFWKTHDAINTNLLRQYLSSVADAEQQVIGEMERVSGDVFPGDRVRVDMTVYGSWAGAYSVLSPRFNLFISSLDPFHHSNGFLEVVFHESSHLLFGRDSPFRSEIYVQARKLGIDFPRGLWHACLFYLCGIATQEYLEERGGRYELMMEVKDIFSRTNTARFRNILDLYYAGELDRLEAVEQLLME